MITETFPKLPNVFHLEYEDAEKDRISLSTDQDVEIFNAD